VTSYRNSSKQEL